VTTEKSFRLEEKRGGPRLSKKKLIKQEKQKKDGMFPHAMGTRNA